MDSQSESIRGLARPYRKAVLKALLILTIVAGVVFITLNLLIGRFVLATAEIGMVIYAIVVLRATRRAHNVERWALAFLIPFCLTMLVSMMSPQSSPTVFAWVLVVPILTHLLLGRQKGLVISCIFMVLTGIIYLFKHQNQPVLLEALAIANVTLIGLCILAFSHVYEWTRERSELRLVELAETDSLTGLANRIRLKDTFLRERSRAMREGTPLSIIVIDLDHFKNVNDKYGHEAGDIALQRVAEVLRTHLRASDLPARMGGEEFGILLANTNSKQAAEVSEKIRENVENLDFSADGEEVRITLSGGIAELGRDGDDLRSLLAAADRRLYRAKSAGRNQIAHPTPDLDDGDLLPES